MIRIQTPLTQILRLVLLTQILTYPLIAQETEISIPFHFLAQDQGLQDLNNAFVTKDSRGFIWISSFENGLFRFDGRSFENYKTNPTDPTSIGTNHITSRCFEDEDGNLWFSSYDAINCYIRKQGNFRTYRISDSTGTELKNFYSAFHLDQEKNLWVRLGDRGGTLYLFNIETTEASFQHQMYGQRFSVVEDDSGKVTSVLSTMVSPQAGAILYSYGSLGELSSEVSLLSPEFIQRKVSSFQSYISGSGSAWIGTSAGLAEVTEVSRAASATSFFPTFNQDTIGWAWSILPFDDSHLLVSTTRQGLLLFNLEERRFVERIAGDKDDVFGIDPEAPLFELYLDSDSILWVSSYSNGLYYGSPNKKKFDRLRFGESSSTVPEVRYLAEDSKGDVWGMEPKGTIWRFEAETEAVQEVTFPNARFNSFKAPASLYKGQNGRIWLADGGKLFLLENQVLLPIDTLERAIDNLFELKSGKILLTSTERTFLLEPLGEREYRRTAFQDPDSGEDTWFTAALQDAEGRIYLSLDYNRIVVFQESSEGLVAIAEVENPSHFWGAYEDIDNNCIWLTTPVGLGRLDKEDYQFQGLDLAVELGTCWGLLADQEENLWLSNGDGLHRYSTKEQNFHSYHPADGSFRTGYTRYAFLQRTNGEIWFGGREGITVFDPERIQFLATSAQIQLKSLKVHGKPFQMTDSTQIGEVKSFNLGPGQNYLEFEFVALEFSDPSAIQYQFQLDGYDRNWVNAGSLTRAAYQKLPPGSYTLFVRATNSDGLWSDPLELKLTIRPWFYQTGWFKGAMILLIIGIGILIYRAQLKRRLREEAVKNLQELNAFKSRFFTNITHEFRSPLNIILSYLDTALQRNKSLKKGNLEIMQRSGKQLLYLVNQILDLRRLEVAKVEVQYEEMDGAKLAKAVVEDFQKLAYGKGIKLDYESESTEEVISSDREKLRKILSNLVSNAIKFTSRGGVVKLQVEQKNGSIQFSVADTGTGIAKDKLPHIFEQFYQAHDESTNKFGSGVGLALSQELAQAMGGKITVKSKVGQGSTFALTLPRKAMDQEELDGLSSHTQEDLMTAGDVSLDPIDADVDTEALAEQLYVEAIEEREGKPLVLIVEDNVNFRTYIQEILSPHYRTVIRSNGEDGLKAALKLVPDLVVTDVKMPIMDGYELTAALKANAATCHIPIILLTGLDDIDARVKGIQTGADIYLNKPFHEQELLSWIHNLLKLREKLQGFYRGIGVSTSDESYEPHESNDPDREFIRRVKKAIEENFHRDTFSVKELSEIMNMEYVTFYRKFKAIMNENAKKTIQDRRLSKARELLINEPSKQIREIAFEVGFSDPGYFSKTFREAVNMTPKEFREQTS